MQDVDRCWVVPSLFYREGQLAMYSVLAVCLSLASLLATGEGVEWPPQVSALLVGGMCLHFDVSVGARIFTILRRVLMISICVLDCLKVLVPSGKQT